ncbi:hypothetical protein GCM10023238_27040 [Streptomyces heliomycini]
MRALDAALPARDGVAVFNRVYLVRHGGRGPAVRHRPVPGRTGGDHAGRTCGRGALSGGGGRGVAGAAAAGLLAPAVPVPRHPGVRPLQFALAGINAHIGHDLALAVGDTLPYARLRPLELRTSSTKWAISLLSLEDRIREELIPGPEVLRIADR